ncbi:RHS repeat-associated core domain-containing protein [Streptomyces sp. Termitarium-T10T-6]|nr:RHS repeat-associated core domain-containing protein [Streptomyces sp. Termitarium-T10T-6]SCE57213.1 RHS repeat-associated core domain-containing protein [Streptomyces sp. Termitarium-T10T-6]
MTIHSPTPQKGRRLWSGGSLRYIAGSLTLALTVTLADGASAAAGPRSEAPAAPKKPTVTQAADIPSARVAARLSGKRVEALSERTETSTTWANKDGSLTTELTAGPVRFEDGATGGWRDVDLDLVAVAGGGVEPKAHPEGLKLAGKTGTPASSIKAAQAVTAADLVTLGEGDEQITLQWKGGLPAPKLSGNRAEYVNAVPGADVVVEATRTGFEQYVEIKQKPTTDGYTYTLPLKAKGLKAKQQADGSVVFRDKKNKKTAVMPAPVMWDSTVDEASGEHTRRVPVSMKVVKKGATIDLVVTPDAKFLADPDTKYPVVVDPSTSALSNVFDTYVQQGETRDWSTDVELDLGNPGTKNADGTFRTARSFISWNTAPISDALVTDAKLSLWNFHSGNYTGSSCPTQPWEVWSAGAASTSSRWTAPNQPAWTAKKATSSETRGNSSCSTQPDGWINANVTTLVQEWASAKAGRGHMGLRATDESVTGQWKRVNSANAASNPPKLVVTYNYRPRTGTKQEAGPPYFSYGGAYTVNTLTPTLRDTFVDADGDKVNGTFQIFDNATNTQVGNVIVSPYVPSGQVASVTVPAGVLTNGKTYKFRTSPYDGAHYNSGWSAWKTFTVDTAAPSAPTKIVSTDYPADKWVKGAGQSGTFTVTPPAADHQWLEWSLDETTWTKVLTSGSSAAKSISITPPKDGSHTLLVRAVDKADNKSEAMEYGFHAGPGGFLQPTEGERTARRLPLSAEADAAKYNAVSFSWRRSETDPWVKIPVADVTLGGNALSAWPVALANGKNDALVWNTVQTVDPDGAIQLKADFTGPNSASGSTEPLSVVVDRNADGAASEQVGPGHVNLLTGDYRLAGTEETYFDLSASRTSSSRRPSAGGQQEGQAAIFGKEWVSGTAAEVTQLGYTHIRRTSSTSLDVVLDDGSTVFFTAKANDPDGWVPEPGMESLTLKGTFGGTFTLTDTDGTETDFAKVNSAAETWQVTSSGLTGIANTSTDLVSEAVVVAGKTLARPKRVIASRNAVSNAVCAATPATKGCRALEFVYASSTTATADSFGDVKDQVKEIRLWSTEPGAANATSKAVQTYLYDGSGRLRQTWNPQISPSLKTEYAYDGAGRVNRLTPPGQLPWTFTYGNAGGSAGGDGMLLKVSRPTLQPGSKSTIDGDATTSMVYDVPLSGATAPYAMNSTAVKAWGQMDAPTDATAIFSADSVPASHRGAELTSGSYGRAQILYMNASANEVNSIDQAGGVETTQYDTFGNTVRQLSAGNHALALGRTADDKQRLDQLGIGRLATEERAELLSDRSIFSADGTRELETLGPLKQVALAAALKDGTTTLVQAGTTVSARPWTVNSYDEGRPTDGTATVKYQTTRVAVGAQLRDHPERHADKRVAETRFDWVQGVPTSTVEDPGGLDITHRMEYDGAGRVVKTLAPGSNGTDAAATIDEYYTAEGTGPCQGRPEWKDQLCRTRPAGTITGGGSNPTELVTKTYEYGFYNQLTKLTETANGTTRTTVTSHDGAGRPTKIEISGGTGDPVPDTTVEYVPATGAESKTIAAGGGTLTREYDDLGRLVSYTDADGGTTTTAYDRLDRPVKVSDTVPSTTTYAYDHAKEPRGLAVSMTDSVAGTFAAEYNADGDVVKETLPGGYTMRQDPGQTGPAQRSYTRESDGTLLISDSATETIHGQWLHHSGGAGQGETQDYTYDGIGRLTNVADTAEGTCTLRGYGFNDRTNRTSLTTTVGTPGSDCPTTGGTTKTSAYDSADRIVDSGYVYDKFGRTTALPGGTAVTYYANDLVRRQTVGNSRQTWALDPAKRFRGWTTESNASGTWTQTSTRTNHYGNDSDSPRWISGATAGELTRMVPGLSGGMSATTGATSGVILQFANLHGDINLALPTASGAAPLVLSSDEYGNPRGGSGGARYQWLGASQRSAQTPSGAILMGVRLYNPSTGRFLSVDPVRGGSRNAYEYAAGNPVTNVDLDGRKVYRYSKRTVYRSWGKVVLKKWTNKNNLRRTYSTTYKLNRLWTGRVADYGFVPAGIAGIVAMIFPHPAVIAVCAIIAGASIAIQAIAISARRRGQCLNFYSRTTLVYRKTFGWTHFLYFYGYAYPWRGSC